MKKRSTTALAWCIIGSLLLLGLDLWSKNWAMNTLSAAKKNPPPVCTVYHEGHPEYQRDRIKTIPLIKDHFDFEYAENCGMAFGMLRTAPRWLRLMIFIPAALIACVYLLRMFSQGQGGPFFAWSVPMIVSGALGNAYDRLIPGFVVDFFHVYAREWNFDYPIFNVADITITIGIACLLLDSLFHRAPKTSSPPSGKSEANA